MSNSFDERSQLPFQHPAAEEIRRLMDGRDWSAGAARRDRYLWLIWAFETQVMNGGIDAFVFNDTGENAKETRDALWDIGADKSYLLLGQACGLFPDGEPARDHEQRRRQLKEITGDNGYLDELVDGEIEYDLYQKLLDYWNAADPG